MIHTPGRGPALVNRTEESIAGMKGLRVRATMVNETITEGKLDSTMMGRMISASEIRHDSHEIA